MRRNDALAEFRVSSRWEISNGVCMKPSGKIGARASTCVVRVIDDVFLEETFERQRTFTTVYEMLLSRCVSHRAHGNRGTGKDPSFFMHSMTGQWNVSDMFRWRPMSSKRQGNYIAVRRIKRNGVSRQPYQYMGSRQGTCVTSNVRKFRSQSSLTCSVVCPYSRCTFMSYLPPVPQMNLGSYASNYCI